MLQRVLEPEIMNSHREAIDYDAMDHGEVNRRLVDDLLAAADVEGEVLDLGTGTAQIPVELCQRTEKVRVVAVDLAESMLDVARGNVEMAHLNERIMLDRVDAKQLAYEDGRFACVLSNSIVHHVAEPRRVLAEALRVLAPGGLLLFRDLARPQDDAEVERLVETYAGEANEHQRHMFEASLRAALTLEEMQALVESLGCPADSVEMTSDRHWTWTWVKGQADEPSSEQSEAALLDAEEMSPAQLAEAKRYSRVSSYCELADRAIDLGYLATMAFLVARPLDGWLQGFGLLAEYASLRLAVLFLITIALHMAISLPLSFYAGYRLEHRFGLSNQTVGRWLRRYAQRNSLAVVFGLVMVLALYWIIWTTGPWWWLVAAGGFFLVSVLLSQLAPVLILPLFFKIERFDDEQLTSRLDRLAEGTGLSIEGVYRMGMSEDTKKANAMLAGLGHTRRVLLGDTLLESFTPDEIEVIFAHEIGHHVYGHIRKMIVTGGVLSVVGFWLCDRLIMADVHALAPSATHYDLPVWTLPLLMFIITVFSSVLEPLQNIISRRYERQCDRYALDRTGLRDAYRSAFRKLAKLNKDDPNPHPLAVFLSHSHPPISERLAMADS